MRRIRFTLHCALAPTTLDGHKEIRYGWLEGGDIREIDPQSRQPLGPVYPLNQVRLLPPCSPSKIVCVGRNYSDHAKELGNEVPKEPLIFLKPASSLVASGDNIVYPALSERVDFEGELGVVIARRASHLSAENALDCVLGYTCVNDVTARDLQKKDGQWTRGKGFDTFCPAGPVVVAKEDVVFEELRVKTFVDGQLKQDGSVRDFIFSLADILVYVTAFMTLEPGDLIATGTPSGVGPLQPGSLVEVVIPGVGSLQNRVVKG